MAKKRPPPFGWVPPVAAALLAAQTAGFLHAAVFRHLAAGPVQSSRFVPLLELALAVLLFLALWVAMEYWLRQARAADSRAWSRRRRGRSTG